MLPAHFRATKPLEKMQIKVQSAQRKTEVMKTKKTNLANLKEDTNLCQYFLPIIEVTSTTFKALFLAV